MNREQVQKPSSVQTLLQEREKMRPFRIQKKWRPSIAQIIMMIVLVLLILPLVGLLAARLTSNQFVRETESNLLAQASLFSKAYALEFEEIAPLVTIGKRLSDIQINRQQSSYQVVQPRLHANQTDILPPRPEAKKTNRQMTFPYRSFASKLSLLAKGAQKSTLSTYQVLDAFGTVIAGTSEVDNSLIHVPEIQEALKGQIVTLLRLRSDNKYKHPLSSLSRDTNYRVFVAMPVIVNHQVVGAVYVSRTPLNLAKFIYQERHTIITVAGFVLISAAIIGFLFWRLISDPIKAIKQQSSQIAMSEKKQNLGIVRYGTKELADLGQSILSMSEKLSKRNKTLQSYTSHVTHELKSPVTSILGAIELLQTRHDQMPEDKRAKFLQNIRHDGERMVILLDRLRELAKADLQHESSDCSLNTVIQKLTEAHPNIKIGLSSSSFDRIPFSEENAVIILSHMLQNSIQHDAKKVEIELSDDGERLIIQDNGNGISEANMDKVMDAFFTTRRNTGGTGMGLAIVKKLLEVHNASLQPIASRRGAKFIIKFNNFI